MKVLKISLVNSLFQERHLGICLLHLAHRTGDVWLKYHKQNEQSG